MIDSPFNKPNIAKEGYKLDLWEGGVMVVLFSKKFPQLKEMFFFIREMNEPVMVNQAKLFPSNYANRVVRLFTALLQSIAHIC